MVEFRSLRKDELDDWFDHCATVFGGGKCDPVLKGLFTNHFYMDPRRDLEGILVAVEEEQILSTVRIFDRKAYFFGREISVGGIGEVSTRPEQQGKGFAYRLLQLAIEKMRERGTSLSMLRGTAGLYSKLGWRKTTAYTKVAHVVGKNELPYGVRPVDFDRDLPVLKRMYKQYSQRFNGAFTRDEDFYWKYWVKMECGNLWVIEDDNGSPVGYISFACDKEGLAIHEFCALAPYEGFFDQAVSKLCFMMNRKESEVRFESLIPSKMKADRFEEDESGMYMLLNPVSFGDEEIEETKDLVGKLKSNTEASSSPKSDVLFWGIDSY